MRLRTTPAKCSWWPTPAIGIRGDCDIMLWRISYELELFQDMTTKIMASGLGQYLTTPYSYLAITKRSVYVDHHTHENQESKRLTVVPGKGKYIFVYPFLKTREWFLLTKAARQGMMDEHIEVGHRFPSVKLNTTYSFGLDDQEWVVAFESDKPEDFLDLVMALARNRGLPLHVARYADFHLHSQEPQGSARHARRLIWFVLFVWFIWLVLFDLTNQIIQRNQIMRAVLLSARNATLQ